jgi:DNA-binding response OmpR family regulator
MTGPLPENPASPRVLVISDDDDVADPLATLLRRSGYRVGVLGGREGVADLQGAPPDILILDRDLPSHLYQEAVDRLAPHGGRSSFPLLVLGGGPSPPLPRGWHEDAALSLSRPPQPGEVLACLAALRRLAFYRPYRDLVHDLSQSVTTLHALSRMLGRVTTEDEAARQTIERLAGEADRLMTLLEEFQRGRLGRS